MQNVLNAVESVTGSVSSGIRTIVIGIVAIVALVVLLIGVGTPMVASEAGVRADAYVEKMEQLGERAIEAERVGKRDQALAREGWGTSGAGGVNSFRHENGRNTGRNTDRGAARDAKGDVVGGWGD